MYRKEGNENETVCNVLYKETNQIVMKTRANGKNEREESRTIESEIIGLYTTEHSFVLFVQKRNKLD